MNQDFYPKLTAELCNLILLAAGIQETTIKCHLLPSGYSPNVIYDVNDRYILRISQAVGSAERFAREKRTLEQIQHVVGVPKVLGIGELGPRGGWHYLLLSKIPGRDLFRLWFDATDELRHHYIDQLMSIVIQVHNTPTKHYRIGYYQTAIRDWDSTWIAGHDKYISWLLEQVRIMPLDTQLASLIADVEVFYWSNRLVLTSELGPCFAHGDLQLYNVIAENQHVTGIIDWEWAYGGGTEPDFDLAQFVRGAIYPADIADETLADRVTSEDYEVLVPSLLAGYKKLTALSGLLTRMTIYQLEYELHQLMSRPRDIQPFVRRLRGWLHQSVLNEYISD